MHQLCDGSKSFFLQPQVRIRRLKQLPGLYTSRLIERFSGTAIIYYLPPSFIGENAKVHRQFVIDICNTLDADKLEDLVQEVIETRNSRQEEKSHILLDERLVAAFEKPFVKPRNLSTLTFQVGAVVVRPSYSARRRKRRRKSRGATSKANGSSESKRG